MPPVEPFLLLCELYGVRDINETFRGTKVEYRGMNKLNPLGVSRAEEYIAMLAPAGGEPGGGIHSHACR